MSSSSGIPSMFSARLFVALRRFQGCAAATAGSRPTAVKYESIGQFPVEPAIARMPCRPTFSTGLPSRHPAARPSQAPWSRSSDASRRHGKQAGGDGGDGGEVVGLALDQAGRHFAFVDEGQQSSRQLAQLGCGGIGRRPARARLGATARRDPALAQVADLDAVELGGDEGVGEEVLRLRPAEADHRSASSDDRAASRAVAARASSAQHLAGDLGHRAPRLDDVDPARLRHARPPALGNRRHATERTGHGAGHRRDRVGVAAVVARGEHRLGVVAAGDERQPEGDRKLLDRLGTTRSAGVERR